MNEVTELDRTICIQGEADNSFKRNDTMFFSARIPLELGEIVTLTNANATINTRVKITDSANGFYGAKCVYDYDVANRLDLIKLG